MAKRQTRRSISVKGVTYQRLKDFCAPNGQPISELIEKLVKDHLDAHGVPVPAVVEPRRGRPRRAPDPVFADDIHSQHFTF